MKNAIHAESTEWQTANMMACVLCILRLHSAVFICVCECAWKMPACWKVEANLECSVAFELFIQFHRVQLLLRCTHTTHNTRYYNISSIRKVVHTIIKTDPPILPGCRFCPSTFFRLGHIQFFEKKMKNRNGFLFLFLFLGSRKHLKWYPNKWQNIQLLWQTVVHLLFVYI